MLGPHVFTTKKAVDAHVRDILHSAEIGAPLRGTAFDVVADLLLHHPNCEEKIGVGVATICVLIERNWGTRHFQITRADDSTTDFSFKKCINPPSKLTLFKCASRHVIADQIVAFRNAAFDAAGGQLFCPINFTALKPHTAHVDHIPPHTFDALVQQFLQNEQLDVNSVEFTGRQDNEMQKGFADLTLQTRWRDFHRARARLRVVSQRANLSDIKKQLR